MPTTQIGGTYAKNDRAYSDYGVPIHTATLSARFPVCISCQNRFSRPGGTRLPARKLRASEMGYAETPQPLQRVNSGREPRGFMLSGGRLLISILDKGAGRHAIGMLRDEMLDVVLVADSGRLR